MATSAKSGAQFTDQVTPVLLGAEFGRSTIENHFDGYISEVRIWNRALSSDEVVHAFAQAPRSKGARQHAAPRVCSRTGTTSTRPSTSPTGGR